MNIVGLDLSMTATGICRWDGTTHTVKPKSDGDLRLVEIFRAVDFALCDADLAVIEDLPRGAMGGSVTGMVHGMVRSHLMICEIPYALVTAATLKTFATGKGSASKPEMAVAAFKRAEREFADDNQCDAWWLWVAGREAMGVPLPINLPVKQREALAKVAWPQIGGA